MVTVDIHTHLYPPVFVDWLKSRREVPYIRTDPQSEFGRLVVLPGEDDQSQPPMTRGRTFTPELWDVSQKLSFMQKHDIDISVLSLANPWLDFVPAEEAGELAQEVNNEMNDMCGQYGDRLYAFGTLPMSAGADIIVKEIKRLRDLSHMRGVIISTNGMGKGLDDSALDPVWKALEKHKTVVFLHPHYGVSSDVYGPRAGEYGHVFSLALGFPFETTLAVTRMYLSGVWDRFPRLQVLLAHSGGTIPFLTGRIESCIAHDPHLQRQGTPPKRNLRSILEENIFLDAVVYSKAGMSAALASTLPSRIMFGEM